MLSLLAKTSHLRLPESDDSFRAQKSSQGISAWTVNAIRELWEQPFTPDVVLLVRYHQPSGQWR
jgi:hypothetical protein